MDLTKLLKSELLLKCQELGITKCKSKNKSKLIELINEKQIIQEQSNIEENAIGNNYENLQSQPNTILNTNSNYTLVDLFCGTRAFSHAFHQIEKVKTIFANDILHSSKQIFNLNNNIKLTKQNLIDIEDTHIPKSHIITAGFPC